jgi:argininosuccinate lyase
MAFAPEYVTHVLNENFEDAKVLFAAPLMALHHAHLVMLAAQRIISPEDAHALRLALDSISMSDLRTARYDASCEDFFFFVERLIVQACGQDVAGRLHTARSRNDIDMTTYRMRQREFILELAAASFELRERLLDLADRHRDTVFTVHTHTQRAQPTTVAHYLLAMIEQLERDADRLRGAFERTNRCPLGACAITGTGFDIDRELTADLLGFSAPTVNTYGSIATVDYLLESVSSAVVLLAGLGRFAQDLLLWCTSEFGYLRLGDGFVQTSSIMPQKRNPVAIEHVRALASKAFGQGQAVITAVHNTPFGDIVDTEDDLQPLVFSMFRDARRAVKLLAAAMASAEFDVAHLEATAQKGWTTLTELADTLTRDSGMPFRVAHGICAQVMTAREHDPNRPIASLVSELTRDERSTPVAYTDDQLATILSARHFVEIRRTLGGPAPSETLRAAAEARQQLALDRAQWANAIAMLRSAETRLAERSASL